VIPLKHAPRAKKVEFVTSVLQIEGNVTGVLLILKNVTDKIDVTDFFGKRVTAREAGNFIQEM
jgi:hypothetical protein